MEQMFECNASMLKENETKCSYCNDAYKFNVEELKIVHSAITVWKFNFIDVME